MPLPEAAHLRHRPSTSFARRKKLTQCFARSTVGKEKPLQGEVLAVGKGTKDEEMVLTVGDKVLYGKYSGTEVELDGEKYLIMRQSDVLAII